MARYSSEELAGFLRAVDRHMSGPARMVVIGGGAIGLVYSPAHSTTDIDVADHLDERIAEAAVRARRETGLDVPIAPNGVYSAPREYEDRLVPYCIQGLENLRLFVPDRHDLALMKIARCDEHDLVAIEEIHGRDALDVDLLVERFLTMAHIGDQTDLDLKFLTTIERLFGSAEADRVERQLGELRGPPG